MPSRTLDVALWDYRDHDGRRRRAHYGETFELPDSEVERGERAKVFAPVADVPNGTPAEVPAKSSTNRQLVDWLVEHRGADRNAINSLTKAALWQLVETSENAAAQ